MWSVLETLVPGFISLGRGNRGSGIHLTPMGVLVLNQPRDQLIHRFRLLIVPIGDFYIANLFGLLLGLMYL